MILKDEPCPACRAKGRDKSGNHLIVFKNGNKYCNRCGYKEVHTQHEEVEIDLTDVTSLPIKALQIVRLQQKPVNTLMYGVKSLLLMARPLPTTTQPLRVDR